MQSKYHIEKDVNMSDSKIKVSEMPRAAGLGNEDMLYVIAVDENENARYSRSCTISTLAESISNKVGVENIKGKVYEHATSIANISSNIDIVKSQLSAHTGEINTLSTSTTHLSTTVNQHTDQISALHLIDNFVSQTSSFYAEFDDDENTYKNKVELLENDIQQLCTDIITGSVEDDPHSLSINFEHFRSAVAGFSANQESSRDKIEISSGILYDLILTADFIVSGTASPSSTTTLSSDNLHKVNYLAIGIQLSDDNLSDGISIRNRYIDNRPDKSYVCIDVNNQTSENYDATISGIVTYIHTSKVFAASTGI